MKPVIEVREATPMPGARQLEDIVDRRGSLSFSSFKLLTFAPRRPSVQCRTRLPKEVVDNVSALRTVGYNLILHHHYHRNTARSS